MRKMQLPRLASLVRAIALVAAVNAASASSAQADNPPQTEAVWSLTMHRTTGTLSDTTATLTIPHLLTLDVCERAGENMHQQLRSKIFIIIVFCVNTKTGDVTSNMY